MIETVTASVMLSKAEWNQRLVDAGFSGADVMFDYPEPGSCSALIVTRPDEQGSTIKGTGEDEDEVVLVSPLSIPSQSPAYTRSSIATSRTPCSSSWRSSITSVPSPRAAWPSPTCPSRASTKPAP